MRKRGDWTKAFGEVFAAIRADPVLLVPAVLTIVIAAAVALAVLVFSR